MFSQLGPESVLRTASSGLTCKGYGAAAGDGGQRIGGNTFIDPGVFFGGLHDHEQLAAIRAGNHVHPGINLKGLLI